MMDTQKQKALLDKVEAGFRRTTPERLRTALRKRATVIFRLSESDKASMEETAHSLGLTLTDYLTRLHLFAVEVLAKETKGGKR